MATRFFTEAVQAALTDGAPEAFFRYYRDNRPESWRLGQAAFNYLSVLRPALAERVRGHELDPWQVRVEGDPVLQRFEDFVRAHWSDDLLAGPFPQEPAFGSPEAVAQAARTLLHRHVFPVPDESLHPLPAGSTHYAFRRLVDGPAIDHWKVEQAAETIRPCGSCGGRGYVPDEGAGSRACRDCNSDGHLPTFPDEPAHDLLAEVERLRAQRDELAGLLETTDAKAYEDRKQRDAALAEVERLRTELTRQSALWQTALGHTAQQDAEIKSLRAELEHASTQHVAMQTELERVGAEAMEQRNELAELLFRIWETVPAERSGPTVERHAAVLNEIPEALRKAGRL